MRTGNEEWALGVGKAVTGLGLNCAQNFVIVLPKVSADSLTDCQLIASRMLISKHEG